jgi:hypothetical protein
LQCHPDREFVNHLLSGLQYGFDTGVSVLPTRSFECNNLKSAIADPEFVTESLKQDLENGYLIGPFATPPFPIYRVSPIGIAERKYSKKKRLIVDLSAPHDNRDHPSINDLIDKDEFSLSYVRIDDAIAIIKKLGHSSSMCKTDITAAFRLIPIRRDLWHLYGVKWENRYYFHRRLVFGSRSSPAIFDLLSQAVCYIAQNKYHIAHIIHLLDDFLTIASPHDVPERNMALLAHMFKSLHIPTAPTKTVGPSEVLEFLGIILDSVRMEARLPQDKLIRLTQILVEFSQRSSCTKQELLSLLGHLNFACKVVVPGRSFISYLIGLSTTVPGLFDTVYLNQSCRLDLQMWSRFLESWNGVYFFLDDDVTTNADFHLFTDASGVGFGVFFNNRWFQGRWPPEFPTLTNTAANMALLELFPIIVAAVIWGKEWSRKRILFHCDNMATVHIIKKGRSKTPIIMRLMRKLTLCAARYNFTVHSIHVPGRFNVISDCLSRFQEMSKFRKLAPAAQQEPCAVPPLEDIMAY